MGNEEKKTVKAVKVKKVSVKPKEQSTLYEPEQKPVREEPVVQSAEGKATKAGTPIYKKWWFWLIIAGLALALIALLANGSDKTSEPAEKVYVEDNQIIEMYSDPDAFKGKYVKMAGRVFTTPEQADGKYGFQMWGDPENSERNTMVYTTDTSLDLHEDDYVIVDGRIDGAFSGENMLGGTVTAPIIGDATVTKSSYVDVVVPTLKEITPNLNQDQRGFNVTIDKVEYAAKQTRVYITIKNNTSAQMSYGASSMRLLIDGQQIEEDYDYSAEFPELSYEILPGASTSGVVVFPAIDQNKAFQLVVPSIYSDNWEDDYEYKDMTFDIQPN